MLLTLVLIQRKLLALIFERIFILTNPNSTGAIVAVAHQEFVAINSDRWRQLLSANGVIFDLKGFVPRDLKPLRI